MIPRHRTARARLICRALCLRISVVVAVLCLSTACDRIHDRVAVTQAGGSAGVGGGDVPSNAGAAGAEARLEGEFLASVRLIYWPFEVEADYPGPDDTVLSDQSCAALANVSAGFADGLCVHGSGRLAEGSVVNLDGSCACGHDCPQTRTTVCFVLLDPTEYPWGMGSANSPIVPLRSLTVDESVIAHGTLLYAPAWDGIAIAEQDGVGGFVHDGCFRADDAGYGIAGSMVALAAGPATMVSWLEVTLPSRTQTWDLHGSAPHCAYLAAP